MLRRCLAIGLCGFVLGASAAGAAGPVPDGPRLAVLKLDRDKRPEIGTVGPRGGGYARLFTPPGGRRLGVFANPAWAPDGTGIAFSHVEKGSRLISIVPVGGGPPRVVPGTRGGMLPVFTPDGSELAFARVRRQPDPGEPSYVEYESIAVWIVDLETGVQRQLTRWRDHLEQFPSSFSPDGSTLLLTRYDRERSGGPEAVALRFDGRTSSLLIAEGFFPVYSPDGTKIALSRAHGGRYPSSDLYVLDADGSNLRRLTDTPDAEEAFPSWDPSGRRIAFTSTPEWSAAMQVNADGSCPTAIGAGRGSAFTFPIWQPGPGRAARPIDC